MINDISVKKLVEFRRLSEKRQQNFANQLRIPKAARTDDSGGGDYWIRSLSGLSKAFKHNDNTIISEKIDSLSVDYEAAGNTNTRKMYQRNLEILHEFEDYDFSALRPSLDLNFLHKPKTPLTIKGIPIKVIPHHVFSYGEPPYQKVGGVWFVTWLDKFNIGDLGIYSEALFQYLFHIYSDKYDVDPNYCLTIDALNKKTVSYHLVREGTIPSLFESTIDMVKKHLP